MPVKTEFSTRGIRDFLRNVTMAMMYTGMAAILVVKSMTCSRRGYRVLMMARAIPLEAIVGLSAVTGKNSETLVTIMEALTLNLYAEVEHTARTIVNLEYTKGIR